MSYIINYENFEQFCEELAYGWNTAHSYSSECIRTADIKRARAIQYLLDEFVELTDEAGYCAVATIHPIISKYKMYVHLPNPNLKQEIDEKFKVDLSHLKQAVDYCRSVYKHKVDFS